MADNFGALATGLVHDLNNLLTVMCGRSELLASTIDENSPGAKHLASVIESAQKAARLTEKLIDLTSAKTYQKKIIKLNMALNNLQPFLQSLLGEEVTCEFSLSTDVDLVEIDIGLFEQLIVGVVSQIKKTVSLGAKVCFSTQKNGDSYWILVTDNGKGFDGQITELSELAKQCGVSLICESKPWQGSKFHLTLPACSPSKADGEIKPDTTVKTNVHSGKGCILLVEDEREVRMFLSEILRKKGFNLLEASDGVEALKICQKYEGDIDLMITDVVMPKLGGRSLYNAVITLRPDVKVLYITGYTDDIIGEHGMNDKLSRVLHKPFQSVELMKNISELLA